MPIVRVQRRESPYVTIDKTGLNDQRLSFKAKGLLAYLLSLPNDWDVNIRDLANRSTDGKDAVAAGLAELQEHGYAAQEQARQPDGSFSKGSWMVYEVPSLRDRTATGFSGHGKPAPTKEPSTKTATSAIGDGRDAEKEEKSTANSSAEEKKPSTRIDYPEWYQRLWDLYPKMVKGRGNPKRGGLLKAQGWLKKGYTEEELIAAVVGYASIKPNPQYVMQTERFFGPAAPFEEHIEAGRRALEKNGGLARENTTGYTDVPAAKRRVIQPEEMVDFGF